MAQLAVRKRDEVMYVNTCHIASPQKRLRALVTVVIVTVSLSTLNFMRRQISQETKSQLSERHLPSGSKAL